MSNAKVTEARLSGYPVGPLFPLELASLQAAVGKKRSRVSGLELEATAKHLGALVLSPAPVTSDGYDWYRGVVFTDHLPNVVVAILFPRTCDVAFADETQTDRHIAVYATGEVGENALNSLVYQFNDELTNVLNHGYDARDTVLGAPKGHIVPPKERGGLPVWLFAALLGVAAVTVISAVDPVGNLLRRFFGPDILWFSWPIWSALVIGVILFLTRKRKS